MCRTNTLKSRARQFAKILAAIGAVASVCYGQRPIAWTRVGTPAYSAGLAGAAGGPVDSIWYSASGSRLLVRTGAGRVFETTDFEHWQLNQFETAPQSAGQITGSRLYRRASKNLYASDDGGKTWIDLTGLNGESVVGGGADVMALNPRNLQEITIGNSHGVWRSMDGGLTWRGMNEALPNFPASKLTGQRSVLLKDGTALVWSAGSWIEASRPAGDAALRLKAAAKLAVVITASAPKDTTAYVGSSDGRLFVSRDSGATWLESPRSANGSVRKIWLDAERPDSALAIAGNRLLRTVNGGVFWDDVTGSMPEMELQAITADRSASVIYAATSRGIFSAALSLNDAGAAATSWTSISTDLPAAPALDLQLNLDGTLTAVLDSYGVYETAVPHRFKGVRLLSGADLTERPAAPGSLVSVVGAKLQTAYAGDLRYPVLVASNASTQLQVPFESATGVLTLALNGASERWSLPLTVQESAPAIFVDADGAPLVTDSESGLVIDPKTALRAGSKIQIMATGLGKVSPEWPTGMPAPLDSPPAVKGTVTAFLDGAPVEVLRATLATGYVGYYTVELQLPQAVNRGANELTLLMNAEQSNRVKLYLEPAR